MATTGAKRVFIDTNVLVYATVSSAPLNALARQALQQLVSGQDELWISRQILREYAAVVSRPQAFMQPMNSADLVSQLQSFMIQFQLADDTNKVTTEWLKLLETIAIGGKQVHDSNIVATMLAHNVTHLLTHNTSDFARFANLITVLSL